MASFRLWIWVLSWLPSLVVTDAEMTCGMEHMHGRVSFRHMGTV
jgi:hypothetical protein